MVQATGAVTAEQKEGVLALLRERLRLERGRCRQPLGGQLPHAAQPPARAQAKWAPCWSAAQGSPGLPRADAAFGAAGAAQMVPPQALSSSSFWTPWEAYFTRRAGRPQAPGAGWRPCTAAGATICTTGGASMPTSPAPQPPQRIGVQGEPFPARSAWPPCPTWWKSSSNWAFPWRWNRAPGRPPTSATTPTAPRAPRWWPTPPRCGQRRTSSSRCARPAADEVALMREGGTLIGFIWPAQNPELMRQLPPSRPPCWPSTACRAP